MFSFRPALRLLVLLGLALHLEGLEAQPVLAARSQKAAASDLAVGRRLCPNGMDHATCLQYATGGGAAAAAKSRGISDSSTIPLAVDRLLHGIDTKRPKVGWEVGNVRLYPYLLRRPRRYGSLRGYFKSLLIETNL